ncbi:MAG: nucleotidyltransferase family protein [archaeon]
MTIKNDERLDEIRKAIIPILKKNGVVRAGIFGSYARGEQKKGSDIDILVEIRGKKSLLDIVRIERELEERVGKKVDIVEYCTIHPRLKDQILREEVSML